MQSFFDDWVSNIVGGRADKSWVPSLVGAPDIVADHSLISGIAVREDASLSPGTLVLMGSGTRDAEIPATRFSPAKPAGPYVDEMARYERAK